jgi:hypothetical protein
MTTSVIADDCTSGERRLRQKTLSCIFVSGPYHDGSAMTRPISAMPGWLTSVMHRADRRWRWIYLQHISPRNCAGEWAGGNVCVRGVGWGGGAPRRRGRAGSRRRPGPAGHTRTRARTTSCTSDALGSDGAATSRADEYSRRPAPSDDEYSKRPAPSDDACDRPHRRGVRRQTTIAPATLLRPAEKNRGLKLCRRSPSATQLRPAGIVSSRPRACEPTAGVDCASDVCRQRRWPVADRAGHSQPGLPPPLP